MQQFEALIAEINQTKDDITSGKVVAPMVLDDPDTYPQESQHKR